VLIVVIPQRAVYGAVLSRPSFVGMPPEQHFSKIDRETGRYS
jgi:hypothetical protein